MAILSPMSLISSIAKPVLAIAAAGSIVLTASGCSAIEGLFRKDAWAVTYEITVSGNEPAELTDVTYSGQEKRREPVILYEVGTVKTGPIEGLSDQTGWTQEAMLDVENLASVSATAPDDLSASCRILLDNERVIASGTGEPGGTVLCEAVTPLFDK